MPTSAEYRYALCPTTQFYFCSVPFRLDISPRCTMGCRYCFSLARGGNLSAVNTLIDPARLARKLDAVFQSRHGRIDINGELLLSRMPIHFGGLCDPFSCQEYTKRTIRVLSILNSYDYPVIISSKQTTQMLRDDVFVALKRMKYLTLQISVPIPDDRLSSLIEPGAPVFSLRLNHMKALHDEGFHVVARLQPILPPLLDRIIGEAIHGLKEAGCTHVIMECLKIPVERSTLFESLFNDLRWDGNEYYSRVGAFVVGRDRVLPPQVAWEHVVGLVERFSKAGFTYGTTDHGLFHLGNTPCCCGVAGRDGFGALFKANFTNVIRMSSSNQLSFADVTKHWVPRKSITRYINSHSRLSYGNTMLSHLRDKWNKPGNVNAPDAFLGVRYAGSKDATGDCLYDKSGVRSYLTTKT